jgi:hypothetical protein
MLPNPAQRIAAACGAGGNRARFSSSDIFTNFIPSGNVVCGPVMFKRPFLFRAIELPQIIDASVRGIMALLTPNHQHYDGRGAKMLKQAHILARRNNPKLSGIMPSIQSALFGRDTPGNSNLESRSY